MNPQDRLRFADALLLFATSTKARFDFYNLAGPQNARLRAEIMTTLFGTRVTQHKSGVNAMASAFCAVAAIPGDCLAALETNFGLFAEGFLGTFEFADPAKTELARTLAQLSRERRERWEKGIQ